MIHGRGAVVFPLCKHFFLFFFASHQKQTFFPSQAKKHANCPPPSYNPILFARFVNKHFIVYFFTVCWTNYFFLSLFAEQPFFSTPLHVSSGPAPNWSEKNWRPCSSVWCEFVQGGLWLLTFSAPWQPRPGVYQVVILSIMPPKDQRRDQERKGDYTGAPAGETGGAWSPFTITTHWHSGSCCRGMEYNSYTRIQLSYCVHVCYAV